MARVANVVVTSNTTDMLEYSTVRLSCSSSGSFLSFLWLNSSSEVKESDRVQLSHGGSTLTIVSVTRYDQGPFRCQVFNPVSNDTSGPVNLSINLRVANVVVTSNTTDMLEYSTVRLSCSSSGSFLSFLWLNSSSEVKESDRVQLSHGGSTLTIVSVTRYDQGPFRCQVFNPVSNDTSGPVNLSINYGPENIILTISPSQENYVEGSDITLSCSADSRPAALFQWFLNGDLLSDAVPELRLMNIQMSQSGNYSCQAFNNKTLRYEMTQPSVVSVLEKISKVSITETNSPIEGNSFNLTCDAAGSVFTREWMKGGLNLISDDNVALYDNNRVLSFNSLSKKDNGDYVCKVSNTFSQDETKYTMVVSFGPENVQINGPSEIPWGDTLTLTCSAESVPATYTWILKGTEIHYSSVLTKKTTKPLDNGNYTCEVMNHITGRNSSATHGLSVTERKSGGLSAGAIAGIVLGLVALCAAAGGGGYYYKNKIIKKAPPHSDNKEVEEPVYENTSTVYENL
ncbi:LOW QUALITY PROTEIN: carcinoembryonic antigen-related cell adhesion molecule 5-like [Anoplopoma fimbria]|uniref:LOW QUALITY PROTEIN: carcinoembryonic antigen-related cell adhesion molecule 5-like n=1 Tax=Anoplopoma fimbria TaxID=229290 RepID=UPI0023ED100D|nr:LOW QUALITY PROTEIN: carcinoembryonic antigen-related cell adhesion molecule 5-like [Anoplopoma fimbria]